MRGTLAKKLRREARKRDRQILPELKEFLNNLSFAERLKVAYRIIRKKF